MDERLRHALRAVSEAANSILETTSDRELLLQTVVRSVAEVVPDAVSISLRSADNTAITPVAMYDANPAVVAAYAPLIDKPRPLSQSQVAASALARGTLLLPQLDLTEIAKATVPENVAFMKQVGIRGMIVVPLRSRGQLFGVMSVLRHRPELPALDELDRDITEHLASHVALALANARLVTEQAQLAAELEGSRFLDAVIENIPDMVFVKDAKELRFVRFNRAGEELLGVARAELIGRSDFDLFPQTEAEFFIAKDRETLAAKLLVDIPEEPIQTKHGQRWLHTKKVPIVDETGTPRYLLGISEDITARKQALAELNVAKDKAEAANRELEAFSYSVAHDLRAPLRAIDGFALALLEDYGNKLDLVGHRHLARIRAAAQRMATLIDDLLRLSRLTRYEDRRETVNMSAIARISIAQLERAEPDRDVQIDIEDNLVVDVDPKLLAIVFDNLFSNAWKFTSKTPRAKIELGSKRENGERIYFVRDNGAGFDMAYQNKLFGVFQRLHPVHEFPGTGVGLATVQRIIVRHGGRVWAEGAIGKGATFYFTLAEEHE